MIPFSNAKALLENYKLEDNRIRHSQAVSNFAFELAEKVHAHHPELGVDPEKVRIAALLHDIGRSRPGDHEINSVAILNSEGLADIAAIVMHGSMYEISVLRGTPDASLLPRSLENKIVAYADARVKDRIVSLQERFDEVLCRRALESEKVESVKMAMKRYFEMQKELLGLAAEE